MRVNMYDTCSLTITISSSATPRSSKARFINANPTPCIGVYTNRTRPPFPAGLLKRFKHSKYASRAFSSGRSTSCGDGGRSTSPASQHVGSRFSSIAAAMALSCGGMIWQPLAQYTLYPLS